MLRNSVAKLTGICKCHVSEQKNQPACKPGSVQRIAPPGRPFIWDACRQTPRAINPGGNEWTRSAAPLCGLHARPYLILLPVGFALPPLLPEARCALTAPFHPYPRQAAGGLFSVALSLGLPPAAVSRHRVLLEPGLSSTGTLARSSFRESCAAHPAAAVRRAGSGAHKGCATPCVKPIAERRVRGLALPPLGGVLCTCPKQEKSSSPAPLRGRYIRRRCRRISR